MSRPRTIDADPGADTSAEDGEIESFNRLLASYRRLVARIEDGMAFPTSGSRVIVRRVDLSRLRWSMASCELELRRLCRKRLSVVSRAQPLDDQGGQV